jgi:hypothetical protein
MTPAAAIAATRKLAAVFGAGRRETQGALKHLLDPAVSPGWTTLDLTVQPFGCPDRGRA